MLPSVTPSCVCFPSGDCPPACGLAHSAPPHRIPGGFYPGWVSQPPAHRPEALSEFSGARLALALPGPWGVTLRPHSLTQDAPGGPHSPGFSDTSGPGCLYPGATKVTPTSVLLQFRPVRPPLAGFPTVAAGPGPGPRRGPSPGLISLLILVGVVPRCL